MATPLLPQVAPGQSIMGLFQAGGALAGTGLGPGGQIPMVPQPGQGASAISGLDAAGRPIMPLPASSQGTPGPFTFTSDQSRLGTNTPAGQGARIVFPTSSFALGGSGGAVSAMLGLGQGVGHYFPQYGKSAIGRAPLLGPAGAFGPVQGPGITLAKPFTVGAPAMGFLPGPARGDVTAAGQPSRIGATSGLMPTLTTVVAQPPTGSTGLELSGDVTVLTSAAVRTISAFATASSANNTTIHLPTGNKGDQAEVIRGIVLAKERGDVTQPMAVQWEHTAEYKRRESNVVAVWDTMRDCMSDPAVVKCLEKSTDPETRKRHILDGLKGAFSDNPVTRVILRFLPFSREDIAEQDTPNFPNRPSAVTFGPSSQRFGETWINADPDALPNRFDMKDPKMQLDDIALMLLHEMGHKGGEVWDTGRRTWKKRAELEMDLDRAASMFYKIFSRCCPQLLKAPIDPIRK